MLVAQNTDGMIETLYPLHMMMGDVADGTATLREVAFHQSFGRELQEAFEWVLRFQRTRDENNLHQAWDIYYTVFRRIGKMNAQLTKLELLDTAPKLLSARHLQLAVPGTYHAGSAVVCIESKAKRSSFRRRGICMRSQ